MCKVFTYSDSAILLGLGALILLISFAGSLFLNCISVVMIGVYVSFGNRVKDLNKKLIEIDKVNKEINNGKRKSKS